MGCFHTHKKRETDRNFLGLLIDTTHTLKNSKVSHYLLFLFSVRKLRVKRKSKTIKNIKLGLLLISIVKRNTSHGKNDRGKEKERS